MNAKPKILKIPNIKKTPLGCIGLSKSKGVTKSYSSTTISSVIITAPIARSVHTSAA